jgi:uncharacterized membrane protein YfcA
MNNLNWRLIVRLSAFGLAMAIATVYYIPSNIEPFFWLVIFLLCAYVIAERCHEKYFLHGFLVSLMNCVWITTAHILLFDTYIANQPDKAEMLTKMPLPDSPRLMMLMMGTLIGIISGLFLGVFAFIASKIIKKNVSTVE